MSPREPLQLLNGLSVAKITELSKLSKAYISQVKLGRFLYEVNADKAQRQDIETFLLKFENPGNRHAYYRAIRTFYNWREETFDLPNPMQKTKTPRLGKLILPSLSGEQGNGL